MSDSKNYEDEVENGSNIRNIKCKYCSSIVLTPKTAEFVRMEVRKGFFENNDNYRRCFFFSFTCRCLNKENKLWKILTKS